MEDKIFPDLVRKEYYFFNLSSLKCWLLSDNKRFSEKDFRLFLSTSRENFLTILKAMSLHLMWIDAAIRTILVRDAVGLIKTS